MSFSRFRFDHYARELSLAIYDLSLESRETFEFHKLTQELRNVVNPTPISRLKDKLIQARGVAQRVATDIEAEADALIAEEGAFKTHTAEAFAPHRAILTEASTELQAIKDALNLMSNGGPPLDPLPEPELTAPVSYPTHPDTTHELKSSGDQNG